MNVNTTKTGDLTATITVAIKHADYQQKVSDKLKGYRKKANIPGFRPGMVPTGLIKKQYGKPVLIEEVNHILQHALTDHIKAEQLDILGNPMPVEQRDIDWDTQKDFSFDFEVGFAPSIDLPKLENIKVPYIKIEADQSMIDRYVMDYAKRFGKMTYPDKVEEHGIFKGKITELETEDGVVKDVTLTVDSFDKKEAILGTKPGDTIIISVKDFKEDFNLANVLDTTADKLKAGSGKFTMEVTEVSKLEPAALNQELFDKVFGEGTIASEKEFIARIKEDAEKMFVTESDRKFYEDVKNEVLAKTSVALPSEFLKKWMQQAGEKPLSKEEAEVQYPQMEESMKWQLLENKVLKENKISVSQDDIVQYTMHLVATQMAQYGQSPSEEEMQSIAQRVLENKEEVQRINDQLFSEKLVSFFKENVKLSEKKMSFEDFIKEISNK